MAQNLLQASNSTAMQLQWLDDNGATDSLRVIAMDLIPNHDDALSGYFQCTLRVFAPRYYSNAYFLDRAATLSWYGLTAEQALPGLITDSQYSGRKTVSDHPAFAYEIVFSSPLTSMHANRAIRIFVEQTPDAIIKTLLKENGWPDNQVKFQLSQSYATRPLTIQYQQSDLEFIQYLAAQYGFIYNMSRSDAMPAINFYDNSAAIAVPPPQTLFYQPYTGQAHADATITQLTCYSQLLPQSIQITDHNEATPLALSFTQNNTTLISGTGTQVIPNLELYDHNNGSWFAKIRQEACDSARIEWYAVSNSPNLVPGQCIHLMLADGTQMPLRIINIAHQAEQRALDKTKKLNVQYSNQLRLIPATQSYRVTTRPQQSFPYLSVVRIETPGSTYAYLNDQGYYKMRFSYDDSATQSGVASHFVALLQTHGGAQYGLHYPLLPDTLAAVCYINDDINRPILLGALAEDDKPNPGTQHNTSQHNLATHEGHSLVLEDNTAAPSITLSTPQTCNQLHFSADNNAPQLQLCSEQGPTQLQAGQAAMVNTQLQQGEEASGSYNATVQSQQKLATQKQDINQQAATDIQINSAQNIQQQTASQGMIWQNPQDMLTQVQQEASFNLQNNLSFNATQTQQTWAGNTGMTLQGQSQANFNINQNQGLILLDNQGNLNSNSPQLTFNTQNITIQNDIVVNPNSSNDAGSQSTGAMGQVGNLVGNMGLNLTPNATVGKD